jgi:hypothetical protein
MSNAGNMYGRCRDSAVFLTLEDDNAAMDSWWRNAIGSVPYVGQIAAGFVGDTLTANAVRQCPGAVTDHTTPYRQTYVLIGLVLVLMVVYILIPKR